MNQVGFFKTSKILIRTFWYVALVCVIASSLGPVAPANAAIPKFVNFQGKLTKVSDGTNVTNGTYAFEFKLYDASTSGNLLWTETYDQANGACGKLTVTNAIFNAKLGSCNSLSGVDFTGGSLYLSVNFAPTGTSYDGEMSPRKQLVSSPFAFIANGVSGDGKIDIANTGTNQATIGYDSTNKLQVNVGSTGFTTLTANGAGAGFNLTGGNVGIGTTNPAEKLQITGGGILLDNSNTSGISIKDAGGTARLVVGLDASNNFSARNPSTSGNAYYGLNQPSNTTGSIYFQTAGNNVATILNGGNMGIGTTNPVQKLEVAGNVRVNDASDNQGFIFANGGTDRFKIYQNGTILNFASQSGTLGQTFGFSGGTMDGTTGGHSAILFNVSGTWNQAADTLYGLKLNITDTNSGAASKLLDIQKGGTSQFNVDKNGNVGVGTTTAIAKIAVSGGNILLDNTYSYQIKDNAGNAINIASLDSGNNLIYRNNTSGGSTYIGTLHASGGALYFQTQGSNRGIVTSAGNFGIGTTTAGSLLTVGSSGGFTVNGSGAVTAATGITSSGTITLSDLTAGGVVQATAGTGVLTVGTLGASAITADSLDFAQFVDAMTLDASTDISVTGSNVLSITNSGTGNSLVVNDATSDTSPFVIDAGGNVGVGTSSANTKLEVTGDISITSGATRYVKVNSPSSSGSGNDIVLQAATANTSGSGGSVYLVPGSGAGGPGAGTIYLGNPGTWIGASVSGTLTVTNQGPNTGNALVVNAGGQNGLTISWDNLTPYMQYGLVSARQSRFTNSSSYTFDNNVGIGTTTISARLHSVATTEQLRLGYDASNYTSFTTSSGGDLTVAPSGGDTSVTGTLSVSGVISQPGSGTRDVFSFGDFAGSTWSWSTGGIAGSNGVRLVQLGVSDRFTVTSSSARFIGIDLHVDNKLGVGTTSPDAGVEIAGNRSQSAWGVNGIALQGTAATYTDSSTAISGTATNAVFNSFGQPTLAATNTSVTTTNAATVYIAAQPAAGTNQTITNAYSLWVDAGNARFDGNVGIGTTSPNSKLVVEGSSSALVEFGTIGSTRVSYDADTNRIRFSGSAGLITDSDGPIALQSGIAQNVGVGTTTTSAKLHVLNTTEQLRLGYDASNYTSFTTDSVGNITISPTGDTISIPTTKYIRPTASGTLNIGYASDRITFANSTGISNFTGNVGIGSTTPGTTLDVTGTFRVSSTSTFNQQATFNNASIVATGITSSTSNFQIVRANSGTSVELVGGSASFKLDKDIASGGTGAALLTGGNLGIGTTAPGSLLTVGSTGGFTVNTSGAITAATGITSSGTITFSGLTAGGVVQATAGTGVLTVGTLGASAITADSLDFAQFVDAMTLDASTDISVTGSNVFSITNSGTGNSLLVNDASGDTSPFVIAADGNVGIGTTSASSALHVNGDITVSNPSYTGTGFFRQTGNGTTSIGGGPSGLITFGPSNRTFFNDQQIVVPSGGLFAVGSNAVGGNLITVANSVAARTSNWNQIGVTSAGTFDTTAGALSSYGGNFSVTSTRSAGANALTNIGLYATASGAQNNYAAIFDAGNVGIGTTAPVGSLNVASGGIEHQIVITKTNGTARNFHIGIGQGAQYNEGSFIIATGATPAAANKAFEINSDNSFTYLYSTNNYFSGKVGIGTTTISAKLHSLATTEQLRLGYDASNYASFTTSSAGNLNITPTGYAAIGAGQTDGSTGAKLSVATGIYTPGFVWATGGFNLSASNTITAGSVANSVLLTGSGGLQLVTGGPFIKNVSSTGIQVLQSDGSTGGTVTATTLYGGSGTSSTLTLAGTSNGSPSAAHIILNGTSQGNVGIGTTAPAELLSVNGDIMQQNTRTRTMTRTLTTVINDAVDIGSFTFGNGAGSLWVSITVPSSSFSVSKEYLIPIKYGQTSNNWTIAPATSSTGSYGGNDFELDINVNGAAAALRIRRTAGSTAGTAYIVIRQDGINTDTFTASTATASVAAPTTYFSSTALTQVGGNVGIGTTAPAAFLHVVSGSAGEGLRVADTGGAYLTFKGNLGSGNPGISSSSGLIHIGSVINGTGGSEYLRVRKSGSGTVIQQWENNAGTALTVVDGSGNIGIGDTSPAAALTVGSGDLFQVNSSGAIAAATGITSSGTITFSGLTAGGVVQATAGTGVLTVGTLGASAITADALDFSEFKDAMTLDASTDIAVTGSNVFSITNSGTGNSLLVNDASGDTSPFVIAADGNVGIGTTSPASLLNVVSGTSQQRLDVNNIVQYSGGQTSAARYYLGASNIPPGYPGLSFAHESWGPDSTHGSAVGIPAIRSLGLYTSNGTALTERMRVDSSGNVGIGTTTISEKLHVAGNAIIGATGTNGSITFPTLTSGGVPSISTTFGSNTFQLGIGSGQQLIFNTGGTGTKFKWNNTEHELAQAYQNFTVHDGGPGMRLTATGLGIGSTSPDATLEIAGNKSLAAWGVNGIALQGTAATYTDTSTANSGTATNAAFNSFGIPTLAASNTSVTTTHASTVYIAGPPTAGTNQTITNPYSLLVNSGTTALNGNVAIHTLSQPDSTSLLTVGALNVSNISGTSGTLTGVTLRPSLVLAGNLGALYGQFIHVYGKDDGSARTLTHMYGMFIDTNTKGSNTALTNSYGLYINTQNAGTNNYNIYSESGNNYFAGNIGIGTLTPDAALEIGGSRSQSAWGVNGIAIQGTASTYTDSSTAAAGTAATAAINSTGQSTLNATNSITTTNAYTQYIAGAPISGTNQTLTNTTALYIAAAATTDGAGGTPTNSYGLYVNPQTGATNNYAAVFAGGNVGIGTTNPSSVLHIEGSGATTGITLNDSSNGQIPFISFKQAGTTKAQITGGTGLSHRMDFNTGGSSVITLLDSNVGIGTTSPTYKLDVNGTTNTVGVRVASNTASDIWYYGTGTVTGDANFLQSAISATGAVQANIANANTTAGDAKANVQVGGASAGDPYYLLTVLGATNWSIGIDNSDSDKLKIGPVASPSTAGQSLTIQTDGNVGIGTTAPTQKLSVEGKLTAGTTAAASIQLSQDGGAGTITGLYNGVSRGTIAFGQASGYDLQLTSGTNGNISLLPNGTGNVGIGTASPDYALELAGATAPEFALSDTGLAHGVTTWAQTDSFINIEQVTNDDGGARIMGFSDAAGLNPLRFLGVFGNTDPTDSVPAIWLLGGKRSGTDVANLGDAETLLQVGKGGDGSSLFTILGNGNVGVGNAAATPVAPLDVVTAAQTVARFKTTGAAHGINIALDSASTYNTNISYRNNGVGKWYEGNDATNDRFRLVNSDANGNAEVFTVLQGGNVGIGTSSPDAFLEYGAAKSSSAWGLNGIALQGTAATYTDSSTAVSGTTTNAVFNSFGIPTLAATNATVTTTNAANVYIAGAPTAGTNQTITNAYALWVDAGTSRFDGDVVNSGSGAFGYFTRSGTTISPTTSGDNLSVPGTGTNSEKFGATASVSDNYTLAVGAGASAAGDYAIALGRGAAASTSQSIAIGAGSTANTSVGAIALGTFADANNIHAIAIGREAASAYDGSIAFGSWAVATAANQLVVGAESSPINAMYIGEGVTSTTPQSMAINATGASGTNIAAANLIFASGKATGNAAGGDLLFQTSDAGSPGATLQSLSTKLTIKAGGNVGIGTTTPAGKLHVYGTTSGYTPALWVSDSNNQLGGAMYFEYRGGAVNNKIHAFIADSYGLSFYRMNDAGNDSIPGSFAAPDLVINTGGNVGLGTSSAGAKLTIGSGTQTTAAHGLNFGTDTSANLYRSAAATIKTDGTFNAATALQVGGANINTAGTLNNVAYLNQANTFSTGQNINPGSAVTALAITQSYNAVGISISKAASGAAINISATSAQASGLVYALTDATTSQYNTITYGVRSTLSTGYDNVSTTSGNFSAAQTRTSAGVNANLAIGVDATASSAIATAGTYGYAGRFTAGSANIMPLLVKGAASQTSDLFQVQNSGGTGLVTVNSAGNVGIGTTTPAAKLEVSSSVYAKDTLIIDRPSGTIANYFQIISRGAAVASNFGNAVGNGATELSAYSTAGIIMGTIGAQPVVFGTSNSERMRIDASGNVGIGTSAPAALLHMRSDTAQITFTNVANATTASIVPTSGSLIISASGVGNGILFGNSDAYIGPVTNGSMDLGSTGQSRRWRDLYLTRDAQIGGNVGIGTTAPGYMLHIYKSDSTAADAAFPQMMVENPSTASTAYAVIKTKVGTGYAGGYPELWLQSKGGTSGENTIRGVSNHDLVFKANDTEWMRVLKTGNVGIGSTSPAAALDVVGSGVQFSSSQATLMVGGTLASGVNGVSIVDDNSAPRLTGVSGLPFYVGIGGQALSTFTKWETDNDLNVATGKLYVDSSSGNVGIGSTTPGAQLDVVGAASTIPIKITSAVPAANKGALQIEGDYEATGRTAINIITSTSDAAAIRLMDTSNVTRFGISYDSNRTVILQNQAVTDASGTNSILKFTNSYAPNAANTATQYGYDFSPTVNAGVSNSGGTYTGLRVNLTQTSTTGLSAVNLLDLQVGGSSKLLVKNDGNVGIGTTGPGAVLHVSASSGTLLGISNPNNANTTLLGFGVNSVSNIATFSYEPSSNTAFRLNPTGRDFVVTSGNVGIGTSTTSSQLSIGSGTPTTAANGLNFGTDTSANLYRSAAGTIKTDGTFVSAGATVTGTTQINTTGTASTTIGNTAGGTITLGAASGSNLILQDADWGVTGAGAATFSSITTNGVAKIGTLDWGTVGAIFGQRSVRINELANVLYQADKRFTVTGGNSSLFDGSFESGQAMTSNTTNVININIANQSGIPAAGATYPEGKVYVSFYYTSNTYTAISGRVKANGTYYALTGVTNISTDGGTSYKVIEFTVPGNNYMTDLELSITTDATPVTVTEIAYVSSRLYEFELPYVSKFSNSNTLFGTLKINNNGQTPNISLSGTGNSYLNASAGNVGIGTTTPTALLHVKGADTSSATKSFSVQNSSAADGLYTTNDSYSYLGKFAEISDNTVYHDSTVAFSVSSNAKTYLAGFYDGGTARLIVKRDGNVGVGTASPIAKFQVEQNSIYANAVQSDTILTGTGTEATANLYGSDGYWGIRTATNNSFNLDVYNGGGGNQKAALTVLQAGNVGIGTTSPAGKLDVVGGAALFGTASGDTYISGNSINGQYATNANGILYLNYTGYQAGTTQFRDTQISDGKGAALLFVDGSANSIGIGTTTPFSGATVTSSLELGTFNGSSADGNLIVRGYAALGGKSKSSYGAVGSNYYVDSSNALRAKNSDFVSVLEFPSGGFSFQSAGNTAANTTPTLATLATLNSSGNFGIGDTSPAAMLTVGNGDLFQVNSSGVIAAAAGITSSGTIAFSGLTAGGVVQATAGTGVLTVGTLSASAITADVLDFAQMADAMTLDASTDISVTGSNVLSITNSGTGNSLLVNDASGDTSPFVIDAGGNVGIGSTAPGAKLDVVSSATTGIGQLITASSITTGQALSIVGPTTTGVTGSGLLKVAGDVGSAGTQGILAQFLPDFSAGSATSGYGLAVVGTDNTSIANSDTNLYSNLTLTGNAAKNGYASYNAITTSSTTADNTYAGLFSTTASGAISTGTRNTFGVFSNPSSTGANTGGTTQVFGGYFVPSSTGSTTGSTVNVFGAHIQNTATLTTNGTITSYGLYISNGSMNTTGTSTQYGLYVTPQTGADANYAAYFGGNVGIGTTTPSVALHAVGNTNAATGFQLDFDGFDGGAYNDGLYINSTDAGSYFGRHIKLHSGGYNTYGYMYTADFNGLYFDTNTTGARYKFRDVSGQFITFDNADSTNTVKIEQADSKNSEAIYIDAEESTTTQSLFSIQSDTSNGSGADTVKFKITADGSVYSDANVYSTPADVAEMYYDVTGDLEAGELVELGTYTDQATGEQTFGVHRMTNASTQKPFGIISTKPGPVLGYDWKNPEILAKQKPVALVGRVPVKVTLENGPIKRGDQLTNSPTQPGLAAKAIARGYVIGQALEDFDGTNPEQTSVLVFVDTDKYSPTVAELLQTTTSTGQQPSELLTALSNLNMQQAEVFGDIAVNGTLYVQKDLHVQGVLYAMDIRSEKVTTKELCLEDVCINKNQLQQILQLLQSSNTSGGTPPSGTVAGESDTGGNNETTPPPSEGDTGSSSEETPPQE